MKYRKLKKFATGTAVKDYMPNPYSVLQQRKIDLADAKFKAQSNPATIAMKFLGNAAMNYGISQGGFNSMGNMGENGMGDTLNTLMGSFANMENGGTVKQVPVEVEGKEVAETPQGELLKFVGPDHEKGGVKTILPEDTEVYSKRIKVKGKSMADRKTKREKTKRRLEDIYSSKPSDMFTKNSLERTNTVMGKEDEYDKLIQQVISSAAKMDKYAYGSTVGNDPITPEAWLKQFNIPYDLGTLQSNGLWDSKYKAEYDKFLKTPAPIGANSDGKTILNPDGFTPFDYNTPVFRTSLPGADPMIAGHWADDFTGIEEPITPLDDKYFKSATPTPKKTPATSNRMGVTPGDIMGLTGNMVSSFGPLLTTLRNRATDTPNINHFLNYGQEGLQVLDKTKGYVEGQKDEALKDLELARNAAIKRGRNSARGVNQMRALDLATEQQVNNNQSDIYNAFAQQMMGILSQEAQMENQQDQMVMQGETARDLADRQDNDNYYTQLAQNIAGIGHGFQETGKDINAIKERNVMMNLLNQLSKYGITVDGMGKLSTKK